MSTFDEGLTCKIQEFIRFFFRSGGNIEVMGLLLGKVDANVMVVMDCFALPVEGTETRVNVQSEGFEYMTAYVESAKRVGRLEHVLGWYHSHPGYGCWLSGKFDFFFKALGIPTSFFSTFPQIELKLIAFHNSHGVGI